MAKAEEAPRAVVVGKMELIQKCKDKALSPVSIGACCFKTSHNLKKPACISVSLPLGQRAEKLFSTMVFQPSSFGPTQYSSSPFSFSCRLAPAKSHEAGLPDGP